EDLLDIVVAGDDPIVEVGTVEDRGGGPNLCEKWVGVGKVRIMKWIETLAEPLSVAGPRLAHLHPFGMIDHFPQKSCPPRCCHDVLVLLSDGPGSGSHLGLKPM